MSYISLSTKLSIVDQNNGRKRKRARTGFSQVIPNCSNANLMQIDVTQIRDHINMYRQLFVENKINRENAWNINIIDYINYFVSNNLIDSETMLIAAMALDICVKVYEYRVEYIGSEIKKLVCNMQTQTLERIAKVSEKSKNISKQNKTTKKKERMGMFIAKNKKAILLSETPKVAPTHFIEDLDLYASSFENMSTIKTPMNHSTYKFELLNDINCGFVSYSDPDLNIRTNLLQMNISVEPVVVCSQFSTFNVEERDEDDNTRLVNCEQDDDLGLNVEEPMSSSFSDDPIENDATDKLKGSADSRCSIRKKTEIITSLSPRDELISTLMSPSSLLDRIFVVPDHWKNKLVRPSASQFSGRAKEKVIHPNKKRRTSEDITPINLHDFNVPKISLGKKCKPKLITFDTKKYTIASDAFDTFDFYKTINAFLLTQNHVEDSQLNNVCLHEDYVANYSGECNDNSQENQIFEASDLELEENLEFRNSLSTISTGSLNTVEKANVPYAPRAKKVNMRKLKSIILNCLIEDDNANIIHNVLNKEKSTVKSITFTDVHRKLLQKLPIDMKNEITLPLVFFALLYVASERNLIMRGCDSLNDAIITTH